MMQQPLQSNANFNDFNIPSIKNIFNVSKDAITNRSNLVLIARLSKYFKHNVIYYKIDPTPLLNITYQN